MVSLTEQLEESVLLLVPLLVMAGATFLLFSLVAELSPGPGRPGVARSVLLLVDTVALFSLGFFVGVADPRHGSEIVGYPLMGVSGLGVVAALLRLRRHLRRTTS